MKQLFLDFDELNSKTALGTSLKGETLNKMVVSLMGEGMKRNWRGLKARIPFASEV